MSEILRVQVRFLLGPSGSGKTFRCVAEAREVLLRAPIGAPLLFLAPKQATFQIERMLLSDPSLGGYTRLKILSFDRLAELVLSEAGQQPRLVSEEGRLMVLRALLSQHRTELKLFRATARLRGFAQQLSGIIRELQHAQLSPDQLLQLGSRLGQSSALSLKLHDLAALLQAYLGWLKERELKDADQMLSLATGLLESGATSGNTLDRETRRKDRASFERRAATNAREVVSTSGLARFEALWLDGFAELTAQEFAFLKAIIPSCARVTLAFNLERSAVGALSWMSPWAVVHRTYEDLRERLQGQRGVDLTVEWMERDAQQNRFAASPVLKHLEMHWSSPSPYHVAETGQANPGKAGDIGESLRIVSCSTPEAEAKEAAHEILRFVRKGGRYRDVAILVRQLEGYEDSVRRVFTDYEIPFFLDRREPVGHHPLAELTRNGFRTVALTWQPDDWFGALKTGLVHGSEDDIDRLENEALARGWRGQVWLDRIPIADDPELESWVETLRAKLVPPFAKFALALGPRPSGVRLAEALVAFWHDLGVDTALEAWSQNAERLNPTDPEARVHRTLWDQMQGWLENVALAFSNVSLSLRDWLPILEAGLANQTVGVIPPTLDQVLVGAVDRSRNPDLRLAIVLGMNESVFPAPPGETTLLTCVDREQLLELGIRLGARTKQQIAQERYLGYIACTRPRERLVLTFALRDTEDRALNASPFVDHLRKLFPTLAIERALESQPWTACEHLCELTTKVLADEARATTPELPDWLRNLSPLAQLRNRWAEFKSSLGQATLAPVLAEALYGPKLETSVSRLEEFAACPFRFALRSGMRAEERTLFQLDVRHQGSFQHEVLATFHQQLKAEGKRWRDLSIAEARGRIAKAAETLLPAYGGGLLQSSEQSRFAAAALIAALQDFIAVIIGWMPQYQFEPHAVELPFGIEEKPLPAWEIDLGEGHRLSFRGKIDRIDLWRDPSRSEALCVVMDYKSSARRLDPVLVAHGIQLQLLAYLNVLRSLPTPERIFGVRQLIPAGVFFVNLRGRYTAAKNRTEALAGRQTARTAAYQHSGRFDIQALSQLDNRTEVDAGDQFNYRRRKDGQIHGGCREPMPTEEFAKLLDGIEGHLRRMGRDIYAGTVKLDPYRRGQATPCDQCDYSSVCRIDPWRHSYRVLQEAPEG